jgi:hypothetical protein
MNERPAAPTGSWLIQWSTLLAGVSLVLVIANIVLAVVDQSAQGEANQRQQQIAQAAQLEALTNVLMHALTAQEQSSKDPQLQDLLRSGGSPPAPAGAVAPVPASPAAKP